MEPNTLLPMDAITPITPEVMSRQATINVGTIGHVAHGKSTVVKALTGVKTQKHQREAVLNITIHIGYANAKVFQCKTCPRPGCFHSFASSQAEDTPCPTCGEAMTLLRHFSFVDCPGHDVLMATMLNGAAIMDAALLLIAANETFPQSQTLEHLAAVEMMGVRYLIVLQNKIDLVTEVEATTQVEQIRAYLVANTAYGEAPIVPIFANAGMNINYVLEYLCHIPIGSSVFAKTTGAAMPPLSASSTRGSPSPSRGRSAARQRIPPPAPDVLMSSASDAATATASPASPHSSTTESSPLSPTPSRQWNELTLNSTLSVLRSFDVTLPGSETELCGGVVGGTLNAGVLCVGDEIEVLPGLLCLDPGRRARRSASNYPVGLGEDGGAGREDADMTLTRRNVLGGRVLSYLSSPPPGSLYSVPLRAVVRSIRSEGNALPFAVPGGLIAVGTSLDPSVTRQNKLRGHVVRVVSSRRADFFTVDRPLAGTAGSGVMVASADGVGPQVFVELDIQFFLLKELLGVRAAAAAASRSGDNRSDRRAHHHHREHHLAQSLVRVAPLRAHETVILSVGTLTSAAVVLKTARSAGRAVCQLENPMCGRVGDRLVLARYVDGKVRVIGWGTIKRGLPLAVLRE